MSMSQMPNIIVERYESPSLAGGWLGCVAPREREWLLFVPETGDPVLFTRTEVDDNGGGATRVGYARCGGGGRLPADLDFAVRPHEVHTGGPGGETTMGYTAELIGGPAIAGDGLTEHEAVRRLLNYVASLA